MDLEKIKIGDKAPEEVSAIIEIPQGSAVKYEIDTDTGNLEVDRFIGSSSVYPFNYGFIPETLADDGDALDVLVISSLPVAPESVIAVKPIGVLWMEDEHGKDEKILAVPTDEVDPFYAHVNDLNDIDLPTRERIKLFFKQYKEMESNRWSEVENFGDRKEALIAVKEAMEKHKNQ